MIALGFVCHDVSPSLVLHREFGVLVRRVTFHEILLLRFVESMHLTIVVRAAELARPLSTPGAVLGFAMR